MPRQSKSQWEFGELFAREETRREFTVSELTSEVKRLVEVELGTVWVSGEITNLRRQSSGHMYFTLKDASSQLACVLFRGTRVANRAALEDGQKFLLQGDVTVYEARGQYQLIVRQVEQQGLGALQAAFERLKQKLSGEGLFDNDRKRPLPAYPQRIGVVCSPTAAALKDVLHVVQRRNPALQLVLAPSRVQGDGAAEEIAAAIELLNQLAHEQQASLSAPPAANIELILVTRGGGSLEDLWAFNEEVVARAIAGSALPVVSAVGHEIDFTISDFVADLRAATPSAAAEILTEGMVSATGFVQGAQEEMGGTVHDRLQAATESLSSVSGRLARAHPRRRLNEVVQRLDDLEAAVRRLARDRVGRARVDHGYLAHRLGKSRPRGVVEQAGAELGRHVARLRELANRLHQAKRDRLEAACGRLKLLGPEQVLARGYSITTDLATGQLIRSVQATTKGQALRTRVHDGSVISRVEDAES